MDYKFLHKVLDQIISETRVDYDRKVIETPLPLPLPLPINFSPFTLPPSSHFLLLPLFTKHCVEVYGLNDDEVEYVWEEYKQIIIDKIINNG